MVNTEHVNAFFNLFKVPALVTATVGGICNKLLAGILTCTGHVDRLTASCIGQIELHFAHCAQSPGNIICNITFNCCKLRIIFAVKINCCKLFACGNVCNGIIFATDCFCFGACNCNSLCLLCPLYFHSTFFAYCSYCNKFTFIIRNNNLTDCIIKHCLLYPCCTAINVGISALNCLAVNYDINIVEQICRIGRHCSNNHGKCND